MKPELPRCSEERDYSCESPKLKYADGGRYLRVSFKRSPGAEWNSEVFGKHPNDRATRGKCKGFSFGSRRRLLDGLNCVSVAAELPCFFTATLPDEVFCDDVAEFAKRAKGWLDNFLKRLRRVEPKACGFWRIEWQARKSGQHEGKLVPHFHMLVWGLPKRLLGERWVKHDDGDQQWEEPVEVWEFHVNTPDNQLSLQLLNLWAKPTGSPEAELEPGECRTQFGPAEKLPSFTFEGSRKFVSRCEDLHYKLLVGDVASSFELKGADYARNMSFQDWASLAWYHVVGSNNTDHLSAGVRIEFVRSWGGVMAYAAKYLGKASDNFLADIQFGRSWGVCNRALIPWAKIVELDLDEETGVRVRRIARRYLERRVGRSLSKPYGLTLYCDVQQFRRLWERPPPDPF